MLISKRFILQKYTDNRLHLPEAFLYLDERKYLQDQNNIPIIYHIKGKIGIKTILYEKNLNEQTVDTRWRYMAFPPKDTEDNHRKNIKKYW